MEGKDLFSTSEIETIRQLVKQYSQANSAADQKAARVKLRKNNFYVSDFNVQNINTQIFENLIKSGRIRVLGKPPLTYTQQISKTASKPLSAFSTKSSINFEEELINGAFKKANTVDALVPNELGFYCIRLISKSSLPDRYQNHLINRSHKIIYIGKAETQSLKKRFLGQELRAKGHGTFFRSIGAVLSYLPEKGSLLNYSNKNNYTFKPADEVKIINWINENLEVNWITYAGDFSIEKDWISKYCPLLNDTHNPSKLIELKEDKAHCRAFGNC